MTGNNRPEQVRQIQETTGNERKQQETTRQDRPDMHKILLQRINEYRESIENLRKGNKERHTIIFCFVFLFTKWAQRGHRVCDQSYKINTLITAITSL